MLFYVYLFTQIFLQAAAAFEPISLDFSTVEDVRNVKRDEESRLFNRGDTEARGIVDVDVLSSLSFIDSIYLSVGSNNDEVQVLLDFSTSDLTVFSPDADEWDTGSFDHSESTSFKQNETSYFQTRSNTSGSGFWGQDDVTIGNTTIKGLDFAVQNVTTSRMGVLGLGMPEWESTYENASDPHIYENLPMKLKSQGFISKVAYSVYHKPGPFYESDDGTLLFGAVDHAKYSGNLTTLPMIKYNPTSIKYNPAQFKNNPTGVTVFSKLTDSNFDHFQVLLHGMKFSGNGTEKEGEIITTSNNTYHAAIYPIYRVSLFPEHIVDAMAAALGGSESRTSDKRRSVPCVDDDNVVFLFDFYGTTLRVPVSSLLKWSGEDCSLDVISTRGDENFIILGRNVMQYAYLIYDLEDREISIAQVEVSDINDIQEIVSSVPGAIKGSTQTTIGSIATEASSSVSSPSKGSTQTTTQSTTDGTTTEPKESSLSTSKPSSSSDAPSQKNSSTSKAVSLTWLIVSCLFASLLVIM